MPKVCISEIKAARSERLAWQRAQPDPFADLAAELNAMPEAALNARDQKIIDELDELIAELKSSGVIEVNENTLQDDQITPNVGTVETPPADLTAAEAANLEALPPYGDRSHLYGRDNDEEMPNVPVSNDIAGVTGMPNFAATESDKIATLKAVQKAENADILKALDALTSDSCPVSSSLPSTHTPSMLQKLIKQQREAKRLADAAAISSKTGTKAPKKPTPPTHLPTRWRDLTAVHKYLAGVRSIMALDGKAFTLNLSPSVEDAISAAGDPVRHISGLINRALAAAGIARTPYAFAFDVSEAGRLHLHGAILIDPTIDPMTIKGALMKAGGKLPGHCASRQVVLRDLTDAEGWAVYCTKAKRQTLKSLSGHRQTFISTPLVKIAKAHHEPAAATVSVTTKTSSVRNSAKADPVHRAALPAAALKPSYLSVPPRMAARRASGRMHYHRPYHQCADNKLRRSIAPCMNIA